MSKETKVSKETEEVVEAKGAVVPAASTEVSTQVAVEGIALRFPFIRVAQALSQWRVDGKKGEEGALYIGRDKNTNAKVGDAGAQGGVEGILLDVVPGIMEDKPTFDGVAPKRWVGPDCKELAANEGFSLEKKPTGEVWKDTGNPKMRANACEFCYLQMLVPVPEDFDSANYQLFPIGDRLYTPARIEFNKGAFRELSGTIGNIERVDCFRHRGDPDYKFSWRGKICHVYTVEVESKQSKGTMYPFLRFGLVQRDFTDAEKADFVSFLSAVTSTVADVNDVADDVENG